MIQESGEMYLETILILSQKKEAVRAIDICEYMGYSKPSVSRAVGILKKEGYLIGSRNGSLSLTDSGLSIATKIYERHIVLSEFLCALGVAQDIASEDACKMEHIVSDATFEAMKNFLNKKIQA